MRMTLAVALLCALGTACVDAHKPEETPPAIKTIAETPAPAEVGEDAAPAITGPMVERRLFPDKAEASSFLWNQWNRFQENYHPLYMLDDDPKTAWVEGVDGNGEGEWIRVRLTPLEGASKVRLKIRNGYQKSSSLFKKNTRAKEVVFRLLPAGGETKVELKDQEGWQEVVLEQSAAKLDAVDLKIESVFPGTLYKDLCISDVQVFATAQTPDNPSFEKSKYERVMAWKKGRVEAAEMFKKASAKNLAIAPQYRATEGTTSGPNTTAEKCDLNPVCSAIEALKELKKRRPAEAKAIDLAIKTIEKPTGGQVYKVVATDNRRVPEVDGIYIPDVEAGYYDISLPPGFAVPASARLGLLRADTIALFESPQSADDLFNGVPDACRSKSGVLLGWMAEPSASVSDVLLLYYCQHVEQRDGYEVMALTQVLIFDDKKELRVIAEAPQAVLFDWAKGPHGRRIEKAFRTNSVGGYEETFSAVGK